MNERNDGGFAFAAAAYDSDTESRLFQTGMSLRDWFAGQALAGLAVTISRERLMELRDGVQAGSIEARAAYRLADAMLAARKDRQL